MRTITGSASQGSHDSNKSVEYGKHLRARCPPQEVLRKSECVCCTRCTGSHTTPADVEVGLQETQSCSACPRAPLLAPGSFPTSPARCVCLQNGEHSEAQYHIVLFLPNIMSICFHKMSSKTSDSVKGTTFDASKASLCSVLFFFVTASHIPGCILGISYGFLEVSPCATQKLSETPRWPAGSAACSPYLMHQSEQPTSLSEFALCV